VKPSRFYCSPISSPMTELRGEESRHAAAVRRLTVGHPVELFDGAGTTASGTVVEIARGKVLIKVDLLRKAAPPTQGRIIIAASIAKSERFDWLISRCTELGVDRICPTLYERTVKQSKGANVMERYRKLTIAAAKQCGRLFLPQIDPPCPVSQTVATLTRQYPRARRLVGSAAAAEPLIDLRLDGSDIVVFIGPEGGITDAEAATLSSCGAVEVHLCEGILRTETAAVTFAAVLACRRYAQGRCSNQAEAR